MAVDEVSHRGGQRRERTGHGGPPRWELTDVWAMPSHLPATPASYYRGYPELSVKYEREPVHPQIPLENAPDSMHFKYVHDASVDPVLMHWETDGPFYRSK